MMSGAGLLPYGSGQVQPVEANQGQGHQAGSYHLDGRAAEGPGGSW